MRVIIVEKKYEGCFLIELNVRVAVCRVIAILDVMSSLQVDNSSTKSNSSSNVMIVRSRNSQTIHL